MARKRLTSLPDGLWAKLAELEAYVRQLDVVRGFGWTLAVAAVCVGLGLLADMTLELPFFARIGLLGLTSGLTMASVYGMIWRPWRRQRSVIDLAAVVERAHPQLKESLVSCIELYDTRIPESERGSALMRELAAKQALHNVATLDFCAAVSPQPAHRMAGGGLLAWTLLLVPLVMVPSYRLLVVRFLTPWQNLDRVTSFWFDVERGDRVVVRGSDVTLTAKPQGDDQLLPSTVDLFWTNDLGESDSRRVDYDAATGRYTTTLPHVMQGFRYYLSGAGNRSKTYHIRAVEAPAITGLKVEIQPPAYTGQPARIIEGPGAEIAVLERSRLRWQMTFNKPLQQAAWEWEGDVAAAGADRSIPSIEPPISAQAPQQGAAGTPPSGIPIQLSADRLSARWESTPDKGGMFRLVVRDEFGLTNESDGTRQLVVTPDTPPTLTVAGGNALESAQASDLVQIQVTATDDVGVGALELHYEVDPARRGILKCESKSLGRPEVEHQFSLALSDLHVRNGDVVSYRVRAADERPIPGPNETWSEQRMIRIDAQAKPPGTEQLALDQQQLQQLLKQLHQDVVTQRQTTQALVGSAVQPDDSKEAADLEKDAAAAKLQQQAQIEQAADRQAELQARLEQLTSALERHPLFSNLVRQTQNLAAAEFAQAQAALTAAEQAAAAEQQAQLKSADEQLAKADEKLGQFEQQFDKLAQLERDLLELNRLAANAEQLARRLQDLDRRKNESPAPQETPQEREHRDQLRKAEENQLAAEQRELTRQAAELLQKQPELRAAARQQQAAEIVGFAQQAAQLQKPQQELADELQTAAATAARQHQQLAERQSELQKQIEKLNELVAGREQPEVSPINPEQLERAAAALRNGNLGAAAEEEERLAKQLDQLERDLQKSNMAAAEQAQKLADQLARQAEAATNAAEDKTAPARNEQEAAAEQLTEAKEELRKLPPEQAEAEKQAAELALAGAAEKQQELAKQTTEPDPESKATPEEKSQDVERLLKENAAAQQEAAAALQKLADRLKPPATDPPMDQVDKDLAAKSDPAPAGDPLSEKGAGKPESGPNEKLESPEKPATSGPPESGTKSLDKPQSAKQPPSGNDPAETPDNPQKPKPGQSERDAQRPEGQPAANAPDGEQEPAADGAPSESINGGQQTPTPSQSSSAQARQLAQQARQLQQELAQAQQAQDVSQQQARQAELSQQLAQLNEQIQQVRERMQAPQSAGAQPSDRGARENAQKAGPKPSESNPESPPAAPQTEVAQAAMEQAQRELQQGNLERSATAGQQAAKALQQLGKELAPQVQPPSEPQAARAESQQTPSRPQNEQPQKKEPSAAGQAPPPAGNQPTEPGAVPPAAAGSVSDAIQELQQALAPQPQSASGKSQTPAGPSDRTDKSEPSRNSTPLSTRAEPTARASQPGQTPPMESPAGKSQPAQSQPEKSEGNQPAPATSSSREAASETSSGGPKAGKSQPGKPSDANSKPGKSPAGSPQSSEGQQPSTPSQTPPGAPDSAGNAAGNGQPGAQPMGAEKSVAAQPGSGGSTTGQTAAGGAESPSSEAAGGRSGQAKAGSGQPAEAGNAEASSQPRGDTQSGTGGGAQGPSSASPSPLQAAADRLQRAAEALRQASSQLKPTSPGTGQSPPANQGGRIIATERSQGAPATGGQGLPGDAEGKPGTSQSDAGVGDDGNLARLKKRLAGRKWGELPGTLQTEILQAAQKKPNSEYADLIRQYFKEIAKTQPVTKAP